MTTRKTDSWRSTFAIFGACLVATLLYWTIGSLERGADEAATAASAQRLPGADAVIVAPAPTAERTESASQARPSIATSRVLAVDSSGAPLEGARVFTNGERGWTLRGLTESSGILALDIVADSTVQVAGRADGLAPARSTSTPPHTAEVRLVFEPGERICGVVRTHAGAAPRTPVRLLAFSRERPIETLVQRSEHLIAGDPTLLLAQSDADGAFCIDGVTPGDVYALACGGHGYVSRSGVTSVEAGKLDVSIEVTRLFGVGIQFIDRTGEHVVSALGGRGLDGWCEAPLSRFHGTIGIEALLAGLDPKWANVPPNMVFWSYVSDTDADTLGPVRLDHEIAGYAAGVERFDAGIVSQEVPVVVVPLEPVRSGRATVDVVFTSTAESDGGTRVRQPREGRLVLRGDDGVEWVFAVSAAEADRASVHGVPFGSYRARYVATPFQFPARGLEPVALEVGAEGARFEVSLTGTGWIRLALKRPDGSDYSGQVQLSLLEGEVKVQPNGSFRGSATAVRPVNAPYLIEGLAPGRYTALLDMPTFLTSAGQRFLPVEVREGEETVLAAERLH
jgi:hypothetical protein